MCWLRGGCSLGVTGVLAEVEVVDRVVYGTDISA
jgi:hypothetical protein